MAPWNSDTTKAVYSLMLVLPQLSLLFFYYTCVYIYYIYIYTIIDQIYRHIYHKPNRKRAMGLVFGFCGPPSSRRSVLAPMGWDIHCWVNKNPTSRCRRGDWHWMLFKQTQLVDWMCGQNPNPRDIYIYNIYNMIFIYIYTQTYDHTLELISTPKHPQTIDRNTESCKQNMALSYTLQFLELPYPLKSFE